MVVMNKDYVKTIGDLINYIIFDMTDENYSDLTIGEGKGQLFKNLKNLPFNSYLVMHVDEPNNDRVIYWTLDFDEDDDLDEYKSSTKCFKNIGELKTHLIKYLGDKIWNK